MGKAKRKSRRVKVQAPANDITGPTPEQIAHGGFAEARAVDPSGKTSNTAKVWVNRGGTALSRWEAAGKLSDSQLIAIAWVQRLWRLAGVHQRVTASYGERVAPCYGSSEMGALAEIEAREDLQRVQGYFSGLGAYWDVFENVCRHDCPAGEAGSVAGYVGKAAQYRAHLIVQFVADIVATRERL